MGPPRKRARTEDEQRPESLPEPEERPDELFKDGSDVCQQLMDRYAKSSAPQHRHLIATAAATRAILTAESLPLTPSSYFASAMANLERASSSTEALSSTEVAALMSFLVIVIPAVPPRGIPASKAGEAMEVLVRLVSKQDGEDTLGVSTVRSAVKCLGVLFGFCEMEEWDSVKLGFESLLKFSVDKRPKVRRCAQECLGNAFKLLQSPAAAEKASNSVFLALKNYIPLAQQLGSSPVADESIDETQSKPELEVLHMFNAVKSILPSLSAEVRRKILTEVHQLMSPHFSVLTRHILRIIEAFFDNSKDEDALRETEDIIRSLFSYVSTNENPIDTVLLAANLLKVAMNNLQIGSESRMKILPTVCRLLAGLSCSNSDTASQASSILKEVIDRHVDEKELLVDRQLPEVEDESTRRVEDRAVDGMCTALENVLDACEGIPSEHFLTIISAMFLKLGVGGAAYTVMKDILLKLGDLMIHASGDASGMNHLWRCIGSAVIAMGPEKMLAVFPISINASDFSYTNFWLVPILKDYVIGSSLNYYMEQIVPLAKYFQQASRKAGKSSLGKDLKNRAHDLWKLLTAFCRHPDDTSKQFPRLAKLLGALLKKYSFIQESVALALKILVNENRSVLGSKKDGFEQSPFCKDLLVEFQNFQPYSTKTATKNMKALSSSSAELLQIMSDLFMNSVPGKRSLLKDAICCLACIVDSSVKKEILTSSLEKCELVTSEAELQRLRSDSDESPEDKQENTNHSEKNVNRCIIMELVACLVEGANRDLVESIFDFVKRTFQETNEVGHGEAYHALRRILEEHEWFRSTHYAELLDVLLGLKTPTDTAILIGRFACFHILMIHTLEMNLEEETSKAFLILNEIILTLKDVKEETRKAAYDILLVISSSLRSRPSVSDTLYPKFISMILGYLSGSSPHISSGAVSALSVLLHEDTDMCLSVPELVPSLLSLLQSRAVEVIKAALGFVKVLASCVPTKDLQNLLREIVDSIMPWSSVSRNHFRSKVTVILEILIRKCGSAAIGSVIPERYKGFLRTVSENRHKQSKESDVINAGMASADQRSTGPQKRKHNNRGEDGAVERKRRKRDDVRKFGHTSSSEGSRNAENKLSKAPQRDVTGKQVSKNFRGAKSGQNRNSKLERNTGNHGQFKQHNHKKHGQRWPKK